jgi:hypothetical protein
LQVVAVATQEAQPFVVDPQARARANPNHRHKWFIPLVLAAQVAFKVLVLDRALEEDGITGDQYGPYDPDYVKEERKRTQSEKVGCCVSFPSRF